MLQMSTSFETALRWMPQNMFDEKSILVQIMTLCHRAKSHYLRQCGHRSISPYGGTRLQWINYLTLHVNDNDKDYVGRTVDDIIEASPKICRTILQIRILYKTNTTFLETVSKWFTLLSTQWWLNASHFEKEQCDSEKINMTSLHIWGVLCQVQVSRVRTSNYIPQYLWDVITCPCPWYPLMTQHSQLW